MRRTVGRTTRKRSRLTSLSARPQHIVCMCIPKTYKRHNAVAEKYCSLQLSTQTGFKNKTLSNRNAYIYSIRANVFMNALTICILLLLFYLIALLFLFNYVSPYTTKAKIQEESNSLEMFLLEIDVDTHTQMITSGGRETINHRIDLSHFSE